MPVRLLKPGVRDSEPVDLLTPQAEVFFYRLLVTVDDYGRFDARPAMLKAACFPIKDAVTSQDCEEMLIELVRAQLVSVYQCGGVKVLQVLKWDNKPRASESKFPQFAAGCVRLYAEDDKCSQPFADENKCLQMKTNVPLTGTGTGTGTGNRKPETDSGEPERDALDATLNQQTPAEKPAHTKKRKQQLPDNLPLTDDWIAKAKDRGMTDATVRLEFDKFKCHHASKATLSACWASNWSTWCANWVSFGCLQAVDPTANGSPPSNQPKTFGQMRHERTEAAISDFLSEGMPDLGNVIEGEFTACSGVSNA